MAKNQNKQTSSNDEPINYWRSTADLLMGLMLVLFLLLIVFMYRSNQKGDYPEPTPEVTVTPWPEATPYYRDVIVIADDGGSGDDGGAGTHEYNDHTAYNEITMEGEIRAAVRIVARDLDTGKQLRMENLNFQLRDESNSIVTLSTYYPEIVRFRLFGTTEDGSLYLPEKIRDGTYSITSLNAPEGYQRAETASVTIDQSYEWNQPLEVVMYFAALRNEIHVCVLDANQQTPIENVVLCVSSTEDVKSLNDGILHKAGEMIDSLVTAKNGTAKSSELPLGTYTLTIMSLPEGYAYPKDDIIINLTAAEAKKQETQIELSMTRMSITVKDELTRVPIEGITLSVSNGTVINSYTTDEKGSILLTGLQKDTEYTVEQKTAANFYRMSSETIKFTVDHNGWIERQVDCQREMVNRMIQVSFTATDLLFGRPVVNEAATLTDSAGSVVAQWTTTDQAWHTKGLEPGAYVYRVGNNATNITVRDTASIQRAEIRVLSVMDIIALSCGALLGVALIVGLVIILRKKRKNKE